MIKDIQKINKDSLKFFLFQNKKNRKKDNETIVLNEFLRGKIRRERREKKENCYNVFWLIRILFEPKSKAEIIVGKCSNSRWEYIEIIARNNWKQRKLFLKWIS